MTEANIRFNCTEGTGDGNAGAAFQTFPVVVGQNGAGSKKGFEGRSTGGTQRAKCIIDFQPRAIDGVASGIQHLPPVPLGSVGGLMNRKIKNGFFDPLSIGVQAPADKAAACQNDPPGLNGVLSHLPSDNELKIPLTIVPNGQHAVLRKIPDTFGA